MQAFKSLRYRMMLYVGMMTDSTTRDSRKSQRKAGELLVAEKLKLSEWDRFLPFFAGCSCFDLSTHQLQEEEGNSSIGGRPLSLDKTSNSITAQAEPIWNSSTINSYIGCNGWKEDSLGDLLVLFPNLDSLANRILLCWLVRVLVPIWGVHRWNEELDSVTDERRDSTIWHHASHN